MGIRDETNRSVAKRAARGARADPPEGGEEITNQGEHDESNGRGAPIWACANRRASGSTFLFDLPLPECYGAPANGKTP